ncbi:MAG TPA: alpha/beta hydrolase [Rhodanobacteraceae bacterium]
MQIKTDIADLHVADHGHGGTTLVFLHYWGGSGRTWDKVVAALRDNHRCVVPDLPGWGQSGPSRGGYRIADLAAAIAQMIQAMELDRVVLVGHSMGGKIAQYLAGQQPGWLRALVLVAPSPAQPMNPPASQLRAMQTAYDSRASIEATLDNVLTATPLKNAIRDQTVADSLAGHPDAKAAWPGYAMHEDISPVTSRIDAPTLLLTGERDPVDPPVVLAQRLVPYLPNPEIHELPRVGHLLPLEAPDEVAAHIALYLSR